MGPFHTIIDQILLDDQNAPPKQRHTAAQIFRRIRYEHGYRGIYAQVQRYLLVHRRRARETFIPLGHLPGQRLEADFGHIYVDFTDGRRQIPFLVATWAYSNAPFVLALPFERTEAILEGMVAAFEFFRCLPREVWWDNPKTVATLILQGRERVVQSLFGPFQIAARFAEEQSVAAPLPSDRFDACVIHPAAVVDKYQTVAFDTNRYSVPRPFAVQMVVVKGYVDKVVIADRERIIATHARSHERHTVVLDPLHYLATLGRKPGALDSAPVFRDWALPACFVTFRAALERQHGGFTGSRQFARILQLLAEHPSDARERGRRILS